MGLTLTRRELIAGGVALGALAALPAWARGPQSYPAPTRELMVPVEKRPTKQMNNINLKNVMSVTLRYAGVDLLSIIGLLGKQPTGLRLRRRVSVEPREAA